MDRMLEQVIDEFEELLQMDYPEETALRIMEIESKWIIAKAMRDCFESTNEFPSVPEAIVMAGNSIKDALEGS